MKSADLAVIAVDDARESVLPELVSVIEVELAPGHDVAGAGALIGVVEVYPGLLQT
jgi:hypothetical protein